MNALISKLRVLGNTVEVVNDRYLIMIDRKDGVKKVVSMKDKKVRTSEGFKDIKALGKTNYFIVIDEKGQRIIKGTGEDKNDSSSTYKELSKGIVVDEGKIRVIAKEDGGLYGVIDENDEGIIPFFHSEMSVYKVRNKPTFVGVALDSSKIYDHNGRIHSVTNAIGGQFPVIVCRDRIVVQYWMDKPYQRGGRRGMGPCIRLVEYTLEGRRIRDFKNVEVMEIHGRKCILDATNKRLVGTLDLADEL